MKAALNERCKRWAKFAPGSPQATGLFNLGNLRVRCAAASSPPPHVLAPLVFSGLSLARHHHPGRRGEL